MGFLGFDIYGKKRIWKIKPKIGLFLPHDGNSSRGVFS